MTGQGFREPCECCGARDGAVDVGNREGRFWLCTTCADGCVMHGEDCAASNAAGYQPPCADPDRHGDGRPVEGQHRHG